MSRFFVDDEQINGDRGYIIGNDVNHIKNVLRLKPTDTVTICNRQGTAYCCIIEKINEDRVDLLVESNGKINNELETKIYLFQGLPKSDKLELIIQKCIELGVYEIIPVKMKRSIVKLTDQNAKKKVVRWNKIAESAAKQSKRGVIPEVRMPMDMSEALEYARGLDVNLVPYELAGGMKETKKIIHGLQGTPSVGIFIGPEGGFESEEIDKLIDIDAKIISLGRRILRTETAGLMLMSVLMFELEER